MLWVGWMGFTGGIALVDDGCTGMAITVIHIYVATASLLWMMIECFKYGKLTLVGRAT